MRKPLIIILILAVLLVLPIVPIKTNTNEEIKCSAKELSQKTGNGTLPYIPTCYKEKTQFKSILYFVTASFNS